MDLLALIKEAGPARPITAAQLAALTGGTDRQVRRLILDLIIAGHPIAASINPDAPGYYYITDPKHLHPYLAVLKSRALSTLRRYALVNAAACRTLGHQLPLPELRNPHANPN